MELYALTKLVADDKHMDLVPVGAGVGTLDIDGIKFARDDGKLVRVEGCTPAWGDLRPVELFVIGAPARVEITGPAILKAKFGFGNVWGLKGKPVIPALHKIGVICENVINTLEASVKR